MFFTILQSSTVIYYRSYIIVLMLEIRKKCQCMCKKTAAGYNIKATVQCTYIAQGINRSGGRVNIALNNHSILPERGRGGVGWSDLALFSIFETYTLLSIRYIFKSSIPKNRQFPARKRRRTRRKLFIFKKSPVYI